MNNNIKSISGNQISPNLIGPECIRARKIYDWVVLSNRYRNKVEIPDVGTTGDCAAVLACIASGVSPDRITITCAEDVTARQCRVVPTGVFPIPDIPSARLVTVFQSTVFILTVTCNSPIAPVVSCSFRVPIHFTEDVILCNPDGTIITCEFFDVQCRVVFDAMLGNNILLDVLVCKNIFVEQDVILEVEAKFCGPRQPIPIDDILDLRCPIPNFPEQCPTFFPPDNCLCQGAADVFSTVTITVADGGLPAPVTGRLVLNADICDQCTLADSRLTATFLDFPETSPAGEPAVDQSFTFDARQFNQPTCEAGVLTVTGVGRFRLAGQSDVDVTFTLTINDNLNTVNLTIREQAGVDLFVATGPIGASVSVRPCSRF